MPLPLPGDGRCSVVASVWRGVREDRHRSLSQWLYDEIDCAQRMDPSVIDHPRNPLTGESLAPKDHLNAVHFSVRTVCTVRKRWESLVFKAEGVDRRFYELCTLSALKNALRSGDLWVQGSRQFKDFGDDL